MRTKIIVNINSIWIAAIIFLNLNGFYLLDGEVIPIYDIALVVEMIFCAYVCFGKKGNVKYKYKWMILFAIVWAICSAVMANYKYSQPFLLGVRAQRHWLGAMMMYFPISKLLQTDKISKEKILKLIDTINLLYIPLLVLQYAVGDSLLFLKVQTNERYDSLRLYVSLAFVMISYFVHLHRILEHRQWKWRDVFWCIVPLFLHCFITKSRMGIVSVMGATVIAVLLIRFSLKKVLFLICVIVSCITFLYSGIGQDIISLVFNEGTSMQDTSEIRDLGRAFFIRSNIESPNYFLFGSGYVNLSWTKSVTMSGYNDGYYYNDHGIFGLFFYYGVFFVLWLLVFYICLIHESWRGNKGLAYYLIFGIIGMYSLLPACYDTTIAFAIIVALIETYTLDREREKLL